MGDGTIVETSKNSEIQLNILNNNEYSVTVKEANSPNYRQVIGNTSDFIEQTALGERRKDLLKKLSLTVGSSSLGLSLYETFRYDKKLYKVTKGPNKGKQVDIYKRTKKGEIQLKNNKPQFRSKQAKWHYTKGRLLKAGGRILNILNLGIVIYDISESNYRPTFKQKLDLAVAIFAFVPNFGWIVSGIYFILDAFGVIDWLIEMFREESNYEFDYIEVPKTRVVEEVYFEEFSDTKLLGDWRDREININIPMLKNNEQERIKK